MKKNTLFLFGIFLLLIIPSTLAAEDIDIYIDTVTLSPPVLFLDEQGRTGTGLRTNPVFYIRNNGDNPVNFDSVSYYISVSTSPRYKELMDFYDYISMTDLNPEVIPILVEDRIESINTAAVDVSFTDDGAYLYVSPIFYAGSTYKFKKPGTYYAFLWIDDHNRIRETDETNNIAVVEFTIPERMEEVDIPDPRSLRDTVPPRRLPPPVVEQVDTLEKVSDLEEETPQNDVVEVEEEEPEVFIEEPVKQSVQKEKVGFFTKIFRWFGRIF
jgi:hypothetical protein